MVLILGIFPHCARRDRTARGEMEDRFQIEGLGNLRIRVPKCQTQSNERSQEVIDNKGDHFFELHQSQQIYEDKRVVFVKPRGY
jgi:hypothetical protein